MNSQFTTKEVINMMGYKQNIEKLVKGNNFFRNVVYTARNCQLVLMSLKPHEDIGMEVHADNDQFFRFEKGSGKAIVDGNEYELEDGDALLVPAGSRHNIINVSADTPLKFYTLYSPPHHRDGVVHKTKKEANNDEEEFDGKTTE